MAFWTRFSSRTRRPAIVSAPMANVTDAAFRRVLVKCGKPDVMWTEFVSTEALTRATDPSARRKILLDLKYDESERPVVAQLFGSDPRQIADCVRFVRNDLKFDGVGGVCKSGAGAELIKSPGLATEILKAAIEASEPGTVSVKTRIGWSSPAEMEAWLERILDVQPAAVTLHLRTRKDMSLVPARWTAEVVGKAVAIARRHASSSTRILANGDVQTRQEALYKAEEWGLDGVMVGRGLFGNPFLFAPLPASFADRLDAMVYHTNLFAEELLPYGKSWAYMRKHYKAYISGFPGAKDWRARFMVVESAREVESVVEELRHSLADSSGLLAAPRANVSSFYITNRYTDYSSHEASASPTGESPAPREVEAERSQLCYKRPQ